MDRNKRIEEIQYNHLNLPKKIVFEELGEMDYLYDANGVKLKKKVTAEGGSAITNTHYLDGFQYTDDHLDFFPHAEGYVNVLEYSELNYVYTYKDHLGNIRLRYALDPQAGALAILEEDHYYPFGLKHRGYNGEHEVFERDPQIGVVLVPVNPFLEDKFKYKFGGKELQSEFNLEMYDFGARNYDPAIGRWMNMDPVTHFNISTYTAFDNNPVYFADPSGTTTVSSIQEAFDATPNGSNSTWNPDGNGGYCDDCPQEGQTKYEQGPMSVGGPSFTKKYYHSGGVNGSKSGWYSENSYFELFRTTIRAIGQGQASIESLHNYSFTDEILIAMVSWSLQAYDYYGGQVPKASGYTKPMDFDSPFFTPGLAFKLIQLQKTSRFAFWSGSGTQQRAIDAGYTVLGQTRAGQNLVTLTKNMSYSPGSQSYLFWGRLSSALAGTVPKGGTTNVFLTRSAASNPTSIWNVYEKPILIKNNVKIKYNWVD